MIEKHQGAFARPQNEGLAEPPASKLPARNLKIEADGDSWRGAAKPKIRLTGRWLERAGFPPGKRVLVTCLEPGVILLRSAA